MFVFAFFIVCLFNSCFLNLFRHRKSGKCRKQKKTCNIIFYWCLRNWEGAKNMHKCIKFLSLLSGPILRSGPQFCGPLTKSMFGLKIADFRSRRKKYYKNKSSYGLFQETTKSRESSKTTISDKIGFVKKFAPRRRRNRVFSMKPRKQHIIITTAV